MDVVSNKYNQIKRANEMDSSNYININILMKFSPSKKKETFTRRHFALSSCQEKIPFNLDPPDSKLFFQELGSKCLQKVISMAQYLRKNPF